MSKNTCSEGAHHATIAQIKKPVNNLHQICRKPCSKHRQDTFTTLLTTPVSKQIPKDRNKQPKQAYQQVF